jgi:hypothetical protein
MSATDEDFLGALQVGDDGVTFAQDLAGEGESDTPPGEQQPKTVEEQLAEANERLKKYKALDFMADALERDPSKIHDVRGALEGRRAPVEHVDPPKPPDNAPKTIAEAIERLTPEQRAKLDETAVSEPAKYGAMMADLSRQMAEQSIATSAAPIIEATVDSAIANFKLSKSSDSTYKFAAPHFEEEMSDFDKRQFYQMTPAKRTRELELRWGMAEAKVLRKGLNAAPRSPRNVGGGGGGGGSAPVRSGGPGKVPDDIARLAALSGLKPGQVEKIWKEVER